jgi:hypothetical protein
MSYSGSITRLTAVTGFVVFGILSFFAIIGVFGLMAAIGGLILFAIAALVSTARNPGEAQR